MPRLSSAFRTSSSIKRKCRATPSRTVTPTNHSLSLPLPSNTKEYSPLEAIKVISPFPVGSTSRGKAISQILEKKLVPVERSGLYRMLQRHEAGERIKDKWNCAGRPRMISDEGLLEIKQNLLKHSGKTIAKEEVKKNNSKPAGFNYSRR